MKFLLAVATLLLLFFDNGYAQVDPNQVVCGIYYSYDLNGERILRKDDCVGNEHQEGIDKGLHTTVYPNPTDGPVTVGFNELVQSARIMVKSMGGEVLQQWAMGEGYDMELDISAYAPGSYLLTIYVIREDESEASESAVIIKNE